MRTTLSLDRDVLSPPKSKANFKTKTVDLGQCKLKSINNIADAIAFAEGDTFK